MNILKYNILKYNIYKYNIFINMIKCHYLLSAHHRRCAKKKLIDPDS